MRNRYSLLLCPIVASLFLSCGKDGETGLDDVLQKGTTVITANIESLLLGDDVRTWPEGAYVGVFGSKSGTNEKYVLKKAGAGLRVADFYGPLVSGETITAYYPWSATYTGRAEAMPMEVPVEQEYADVSSVEVFGKYCPTAYACMKGSNMDFFYPAGLLRVIVDLPEAINVTGIVFSTPGGAVAGKGAVLPDGGIEMAGGASETVSLACAEPVATIRPEGGAVNFHITTLPGTFAVATLIIYVQGEDPIVCTLDGITIPRISASDYKVASVKVHSSGPQGFTVNEEEFD